MNVDRLKRKLTTYQDVYANAIDKADKKEALQVIQTIEMQLFGEIQTIEQLPPKKTRKKKVKKVAPPPKKREKKPPKVLVKPRRLSHITPQQVIELLEQGLSLAERAARLNVPYSALHKYEKVYIQKNVTYSVIPPKRALHRYQVYKGHEVIATGTMAECVAATGYSKGYLYRLYYERKKRKQKTVNPLYVERVDGI